MNDSIQAIQESYTRIKLLSNDLQTKDQTINVLQERIQELEEEMQNINKDKEYVERQFQILQEEHDNMFDNTQKKSKQLQQFNQQLLVALKEVQDKNQELLDRIKYQQQEIQQRSQGQVEVQEQVGLIKDAVKSLEEELVSSQKRNSILKKEKQEIENQMKNLLSEKSQKDMQLKLVSQQIENENELLKNELNDYRLKLETQHNELVELKYIKVQYEDLDNKSQQLVEQYNIQVQNGIEAERNFNNQFEEMNQANHKLQIQINEVGGELQSLKEYSQQIELQNQDFQRLFNYIQQQINETIEEVLTVKQKKITVYERLYEGRKSTNRKSIPKKKKKSTYNQVQIEEFFSDIKEIIQSLISTNTILKEENEQLSRNTAEMHKVGEQLRFRIEQLNCEYQKNRDNMKKEHQLIIDEQDDRITQLSDTLEQQNLKAQKDNQYIDELTEQCRELDETIQQWQLQVQQLNQQKDDITQEYEELKNMSNQLQTELEDIMIRKAISQNKVALSYGFISYLMKDLALKQQYKTNSLINVGNFMHYFVIIRKEFNKQKYQIYLKFRKVVYSIIFVKRLLKNQSNNYFDSLNFQDNDAIDEVFEKYIPIIHQMEDEDDSQLNIIQPMIKEIKSQLFKYNIFNYTHSQNSQQYFQILNYAKEDVLKFQTLNGQIDYYKQQLNMLQSRVYQLDTYVQQLESEKSEPQSIQQPQRRTEESPNQQESQSISYSLQNELLTILKKQSSSKIGQIVKQTI